MYLVPNLIVKNSESFTKMAKGPGYWEILIAIYRNNGKNFQINSRYLSLLWGGRKWGGRGYDTKVQVTFVRVLAFLCLLRWNTQLFGSSQCRPISSHTFEPMNHIPLEPFKNTNLNKHSLITKRPFSLHSFSISLVNMTDMFQGMQNNVTSTYMFFKIQFEE